MNILWNSSECYGFKADVREKDRNNLEGISIYMQNVFDGAGGGFTLENKSLI